MNFNIAQVGCFIAERCSEKRQRLLLCKLVKFLNAHREHPLAEYCTHARTHGLGVIQVCASADQNNGINVKRICRPYHRADIARVLEVFKNDCSLQLNVAFLLWHFYGEHGAAARLQRRSIFKKLGRGRVLCNPFGKLHILGFLFPEHAAELCSAMQRLAQGLEPVADILPAGASVLPVVCSCAKVTYYFVFSRSYIFHRVHNISHFRPLSNKCLHYLILVNNYELHLSFLEIITDKTNFFVTYRIMMMTIRFFCGSMLTNLPERR